MLNEPSSSSSPVLGGNASSAVDSFQSIFAQMAVPTPSLPTLSNPPTEASWKNDPRQTTISEPVSTESSFHSASPTKTAVSRPDVPSDANNAKSPARPAPARGAKQEAQRHASLLPADSTPAPSVSDDSASSPILSAPVTLNGSAGLSAKKSNSSSDPASLPASAMAALGGAKALGGAAFVLHVTPAGASGDKGQGGGDQSSQGQNTANSGSANSGNANLNNESSGFLMALSNNDNPPLVTAPSGHVSLDNLTASSAAPNAAGAVWQAPLATAPSQAAAPTSPVVVSSLETADISDAQNTAPQTVRTLQVQLGNDAEGRVDLRLVEHNGGLSVSVRASDSTLTKGLQENLPDLSARLAAEKYQTHSFVPLSAEASANSSFHSSADSQQPDAQQQSGGRSSSQNGGDSSGRQSGGQSQPQQQQAQQQQSGQQPESQAGAAWWRQMAALGKLTNSAPGVFSQTEMPPRANLSPTSNSLS